MSSDWSFPRAEALPIYPFLAADEIKHRALESGADLIDVGLGNPDQPTPPDIVAQLHQAADQGKNHRYHPGPGSTELRSAFGRWYRRRYGAEFGLDELIVTMGAKEGISHLCMAILDKGDTAIVPDPCYPIHEGAPVIAGAEVERFPTGNGTNAPQAVGDAIARVQKRGGRPKLVIANYPQNPTGIVISREEMAELVAVVRDSGAMLLHDLAYADLDFETRHAPSIFGCGVDDREVRKFAVEIFSMSKSYNMPGWRIGLMAGNERMIDSLSHLKAYLDYGTFMPVQLASAWALDHGDPLVDVIRDRYESRMKVLVRELNRIGWNEKPIEEPHGTMFLWVPVPDVWEGASSLDVTRRLIEEAHVAVSPGSGFGKAGEGHVRLSLIEDPPRLEAAADRIAAALKRS